MSLRDVLRRIGERLLWRSHSADSNGVAPYVPEHPPSYPIPEDYAPFGVNWGDNPVYVRSEEEFYRNLSELLKKHERKWVAYHGDECLGIARTGTELWQRAYRRGLRPGEFYVGFICTGALDDKDEDSEDHLPPGEEWRKNPMYRRSREAIYRDLAELLTKYEGKWVAYHGDECIAVASTKDEARESCFRRGLQRGEFAVHYVHNYQIIDHDTELGFAGDEYYFC
jgi:hypothetical protein